MERLVPVPATNYPVQNVSGPTRAGTAMRDNNKGQDRGVDGREEEGDGWAGVLREGDEERERGEQGTGWPEERSRGLNGWPAAV